MLRGSIFCQKGIDSLFALNARFALIGLPKQVSSNLDHGFTGLILVDRACVEAELYNLHFCSFISVGQRTNEVSLSTMSLLFISSWKKYYGMWLADLSQQQISNWYISTWQTF